MKEALTDNIDSLTHHGYHSASYPRHACSIVHYKVVMASRVQVMPKLNNMDLLSPRLIWLLYPPLGVQSDHSKRQQGTVGSRLTKEKIVLVHIGTDLLRNTFAFSAFRVSARILVHRLQIVVSMAHKTSPLNGVLILLQKRCGFGLLPMEFILILLCVPSSQNYYYYYFFKDF